MSVTLFGIPNCDTVKKARRWLDDRGIVYVFHDYKKAGVDTATLESWAQGVGWERLLNRSGTTFRKLSDADKVDIDGTGAIRLMIANPSLIKRPVVEGAGRLLVGFNPDEWRASFG